MRPGKNGPKPPSSDHPECCGAARHCGHSCILQHFVGLIVNVRTLLPFALCAPITALSPKQTGHFAGSGELKHSSWVRTNQSATLEADLKSNF